MKHDLIHRVLSPNLRILLQKDYLCPNGVLELSKPYQADKARPKMDYKH